MRLLKAFVLLMVLGLAHAPAEAGDPVAGEGVWNKHACPSCHGVNGIPVFPGVPNFKRGDRLEKPDDALVQTINHGTNVMPTWKDILSERDMYDVVAYIRTLQR